MSFEVYSLTHSKRYCLWWWPHPPFLLSFNTVTEFFDTDIVFGKFTLNIGYSDIKFPWKLSGLWIAFLGISARWNRTMVSPGKQQRKW